MRRLARRRNRSGPTPPRLITLTGPGGVGKTRLAVAAAQALAEQGEQVTFVALAAIRDPMFVASEIARATGASDRADLEPLERVRERIGGDRWLLVLDNFEHLLPAAPVVGDLIEACPGLRVLTTSRIRLRLPAEHELCVEPLALPDMGEPHAPGTAAQAPAVKLFVERAEAAGASLRLDEASVRDIVAICRRLDGLPLAIELAAARTRILSPAALLARLTNRLRLLGDGPDDAPHRLQTMREAIAWSYDLLTPEQQALFRRLGAFSGGFTLAAAEWVGSREPEVGGGIDSSDALTALVDSNLAQRTRRGDGVWRFSLLETVREFALEQLTDRGEEAMVRQAHADWVRGLVERAAPHWQRADPAVTFDELAVEQENVRGALTWCWEHDAEAAHWLVGELWPFWRARGHLVEGRDWLARALAQVEATPTALRARLLCGAGHLAFDQDEAQAESLLVDSVSTWRAVADDAGLAEALTALGEVRQAHGHGASTLPLWEEALALFQRLDDPYGEAWMHNQFGLLAFERGDLGQARTLLEKALETCRRTGDPQASAPYLLYLGAVSGLEGDHAAAEALTLEAIALYRAGSARNALIYGLVQLAEAVVRGGTPMRALDPLRESLAIARELGNREGTAFVFGAAARVAAALEHPETAVRLMAAEDALRDEIGIPMLQPDVADRDATLVAPLRERLGTTHFEAVWKSGRALPLATAVAMVRSLGPPIDPASAAAEGYGLTTRELEVLRLVAAGQSDREIADALFIGARTASSHVSSILEKFGVDTRAAAVTRAHRAGLA